MLAIQMTSSIEYVHRRKYVYRDISSKNFVIGLGHQSNRIFLIDFGRAKKYWNKKTKAHIPYRTGNKLLSTPLAASINAHQGVELSRRDDMESLGYLLLYFMGHLPWEDITAPSTEEHYERVCNIKQNT